MDCFRVYTGSDGESHFEDVDVKSGALAALFPLKGNWSEFQVAGPTPAVAVRIRRGESDEDMDWHPAPRRQLLVGLSGEGEMAVGDGSVRRLRPGSMVIVEDTTGRGHRTRSVGAEPRMSLAVVLEDAERPAPLVDPPSSISCVNLYAGDDGKSHFRDIEFPAGAPPGSSFVQTEWFPAKEAWFSLRTGVAFQDRHHAPRRQFAITLDGENEVSVGDGESRRFGPGGFFLAEDSTGEGHAVRTGEQGRFGLVVALA